MSTLPNVYTSCYELTLKRFMRCICDHDYKALDKKGYKNEDTYLAEVWSRIHEEYVLLMNDKNGSPVVALAAEIERISYRHLSIVKALGVLEMTRDDEIVSMLHMEGFRYKFNSSDRASYRADIAKARRKVQDIEREIREKQGVLKQLTGGNDGAAVVTITRQFFVDNLVALSKHNKFHIHDSITVAEYVTFISQLIKDYEEAKKTSNGRRVN